MSEVKRWRVQLLMGDDVDLISGENRLRDADDHELILASDYDALAARCAEAEKLIADIRGCRVGRGWRIGAGPAAPGGYGLTQLLPRIDAFLRSESPPTGGEKQ